MSTVARPRPRDDVLGRVRAALGRAHALGELTTAQHEWALLHLTASVGTGKASLGSERIQHFLRAAARVFRRRGFDRASVEEIAAEVGVRKSAIYHYFDSKRDLFDAVCLGAATEVVAAVAAAAATEGTAEQRLRAMLFVYADVQGRDPSIAVLVRSESDMSDEAHRWLVNERLQMRGLFVQTIDEGIASGEFELDDPVLGMAFVLGGLAWINSWLDLDLAARVHASAVVINWVLNGLLTRPVSFD